MMRMSPAFAVAAAILTGLSSAALVAPARAQAVDANSVALQTEGERLAAAGELDNAIGYFETALVADPRNAAAYVGLGRVAVSQSLPGKAIGYFREALMLQPNSRSALAGQGAAYVRRGAVDRARANLVRIQTLCGGDACPEASELAAVINDSGARTALRPSEVAPNPVVEPAPPSTN
jgi:tetratricopeptide (TPR) repeat protein